MTNCVAYNKSSCWLQPTAGSSYCSTCQRQRDCDILERFIAIIPTLPENQILSTIETPEIYRALQMNHASAMDRMLIHLYKRSKTLLIDIIRFIRSSSLLHTVLLLRIHSHTSPEMCSVFGYMVRKGFYPEWTIPRCIICLSHMIRQTEAQDFPIQSVSILRRYLEEGNDVLQLVRQSLVTRLNGKKVCLDFLSSLIESRILSLRLRQFPVWIKHIETIMHSLNHSQQEINVFIKTVYSHPFLLHNTQKYKTYIKERNFVWKEEFIAKSWHPSRMMAWCLDEDEKKEFVYDGCSIPPYQCIASRADWHISLN